MNRILEDIPSFPKVASIAPLHLGITTRVLARRLTLEREKMREPGSVTDDNRNRRRSSKFLEGAAIPNSIIKRDTRTPEQLIKDRDSIRKERDEFVEEITNRLQPRTKMYHSIYDEDIDREVLLKIRKELQRRSLLPLNRDNAEDKKSISITMSNSRNIKADPWEELKEKRRISHRTSMLAPLDGERRPTYESIRKAIQDSKNIQQLLDADKIGLKQLQAGNSPVSSMEFKENLAKKQSVLQEKSKKLSGQEKLLYQESSSTLKALRREAAKGKNFSKKKSSLKSEKSLNLPHTERSVKIKTSSESRRFSKRSHAKLLKEELERHSSLAVSNVLQQRKNTNNNN